MVNLLRSEQSILKHSLEEIDNETIDSEAN